MYELLKRVLFMLPPECAHDFTLKALRHFPSCFFSKRIHNPFEVLGLTFPNRVGLAAGLDNNGEYIDALAKLGFGFMEFGGVTPKAQSGQEKPRLFRLVKDNALINRMGFANKGVDYLVKNIKQANYDGILGANIGKNINTSLDKAKEDYLYCFNALYSYVSYITINLSSPNTPGLRKLQHGELLRSLFSTLKQAQCKLMDLENKYVPMLVKLAPDLSSEELKETVSILVDEGVDGFVFSNTTLARDDLREMTLSKESGGLSGAPIFDKSTALLHILANETDLPIIGLGGVMNVDNAKQKIRAGASLVQIYTGLVYQGPRLVHDIAESLRDLP